MNQVEELKKHKDWVASFGLKLTVVEGGNAMMFPQRKGPPMDQIVLAKPGRDKQIEVYKQCIRNMGKVGIPILCYNFMPWRL